MKPHNTKKNDTGQSASLTEQGFFPFWKNPGETLATMLIRFRNTQVLPVHEKLTYAGRLDPMAEGIVPILVGEARFQKDLITKASKTYEVDILLGISTDTGDMLGMIIKHSNIHRSCLCMTVEDSLKIAEGITELPYPKYSSRPVEGKPLFMHARAGNMVTVPIKNVTIFSLELLEVKELKLDELLSQAIDTIGIVEGDFRQQEIIAQWQEMQKADGDRQITIVTIRTTVSSGTYMRSLAEKIGELLGVPALASRIIRTAVMQK